MFNQKGFEFVGNLITFLLICLIIAGGYYYFISRRGLTFRDVQIALSLPNLFADLTMTGSISGAPYKIISTKSESPTGEFKVLRDDFDQGRIIVKDKKGITVTDDLVKQNRRKIGYDVKFECECKTVFAGWISGSSFVIKVTNIKNEEYEYIVSALTGNVDIYSFQRLK